MTNFTKPKINYESRAVIIEKTARLLAFRENEPCRTIVLSAFIFAKYNFLFQSRSTARKLQLQNLTIFENLKLNINIFKSDWFENVEKKYNPKFGDSVSFSKYVETDDGISETVHTIVYSSDFENSALAFIDKLSYPALEKLMKCQKKNFSAGYVFSGSQNVTIFTIIQLVIAMFIPIFVYLYCSKLDLRNKTNIIESFREA